MSAALDIMGAGAERHYRRRIDHYRPTIPQRAFLEDASPIAMWRDGNQLGKTTALALDTIYRCRGIHPYQRLTHRGPLIAVIASEGVEQMGQPGGLAQKLWELLPKDEIDPDVRYEPGQGITGKPPRIKFVSGPGAGSVIAFGTYNAGPKKAAGATVGHYVLDEPPPMEFYAEVLPRLLRQRGTMRIGFTPTPSTGDLSWLRTKTSSEDKNRKPEVSEHNYGLAEAHCWPEGYPTPWLYQDEIDEFTIKLPRRQRLMRTRGAWEAEVEGRMVDAYDDDVCVARPGEFPPAGAMLAVGIDHGTDSGKQTAVLVAVVGARTSRPRVWFMDEAVADGHTTPEADARNIRAMLARWRFTYTDIDLWVGDRPTGDRRYDIRKSNADLRRELLALYRLNPRDGRYIEDVRKWDGSVDYGVGLLNTLFMRRDDNGRPHALVVKRTREDGPGVSLFADALNQWNGDKRHKLKDVFDAGRYAVQHACAGQAVSLVARY